MFECAKDNKEVGKRKASCSESSSEDEELLEHLVRNKIQRESASGDDVWIVLNEKGFEEPLDEILKESLRQEDKNVSSDKGNNSESKNDDRRRIDQKLTSEEIQMLKRLVVDIPFKVPKLHHYGGKKLTTVELKKIGEERIKYKTEMFNDDEKSIIKANFKEFCEVHDIKQDAKPFIYSSAFINGRLVEPLSKKNEKRFCQYLAQGLPDRLLSNVYLQFTNLYFSNKI